MFKTEQKFPARVRRNCSVEAAMRTFEREGVLADCWVAGRVVGILEDGFVLQDATRRLEINNYELIINNDGVPLGRNVDIEVGDIVEVLLFGERVVVNGKSTVVFSAREVCVLVECASDFYIRKEDPNYLKMVIDLRLKDFLLQRAKILQGIRDWFWDKGFLEVETPALVKLPGMEPYLDVFKTEFAGLALQGQKPEKEDL